MLDMDCMARKAFKIKNEGQDEGERPSYRFS